MITPYVFHTVIAILSIKIHSAYNLAIRHTARLDAEEDEELVDCVFGIGEVDLGAEFLGANLA